jgi:hypothetical protein
MEFSLVLSANMGIILKLILLRKTGREGMEWTDLIQGGNEHVD